MERTALCGNPVRGRQLCAGNGAVRDRQKGGVQKEYLNIF